MTQRVLIAPHIAQSYAGEGDASRERQRDTITLSAFRYESSSCSSLFFFFLFFFYNFYFFFFFKVIQLSWSRTGGQSIAGLKVGLWLSLDSLLWRAAALMETRGHSDAEAADALHDLPFAVGWIRRRQSLASQRRRPPGANQVCMNTIVHNSPTYQKPHTLIRSD